MRLPRHDTPLRLPAEQAREAISADEALLDRVQPGGPALERWWVAAAPAVVIGIGLRSRLASIVDLERCHAAGVQVLERRAGGGALLLDEHMLCGAICVPALMISNDVTESYRWLGDHFVTKLLPLGVESRRVEVDVARADVHHLRAHSDQVSRLLLSSCYGALSPHEVVVGDAKIVGLAQVRTRSAALFHIGVLLKDQSRLADFLVVGGDEPTRELVRAELRRRTIGLESLTDRSASEVAAAIAGATPSVP